MRLKVSYSSRVKAKMSNQHFWYLNLLHLTGADIKWVEGDWEATHSAVLRCTGHGFNSELAVSSPLVTSVLLHCGYDPIVNNSRCIINAIRAGQSQVLRLLLSDGRADPTIENNYPLTVACNHSPEMVALLLADPRVNPADNDNRAIQVAVLHSSIETVELLFSDDRIRPSREVQKEIIGRARHRGDAAIIALVKAKFP